MKRSSRILALFFVAAGAAGLYGCGVGTTQEENNRMINRVAEYDARMMTDDLGLLTQTNRPWRGSQYPIK